jgi:acyl-CoA reductase-like NAD-dependent aldehyde dehydrogenase
MVIRTVNPYSGEVLGEYREHTLEEAKQMVLGVRKAQQEWKVSLEYRIQTIREVRKRFEARLNELAQLMTKEMGKPISQSVSEIKKCLWLMDYMCENTERMLSPEHIKTEATKSYVRFDPLGVVLLIMPWNFPTWQVMRAAIPALLAGNGIVLKHASIVTGTSLKLQEIFDLDVFKSLVLRGDAALSLIEHVDGVSFTGSTSVGSKIAQAAGKNIKKMVLELGGSDPFIVLKSAELENTVKNAVFARLQNNGQSCIASKRFIVHEEIYDKFYEMYKEELRKVKMGDPLKEDTFLGPLSSGEQKETVNKQLEELKKLGSVEKLQQLEEGNFVPPTIVRTDAKYDEEVFAPVAILKKFSTNKEAIRLANDTPYGLGASIWGAAEEAEKLVPYIEAGMVFINKIVASDPRLPFGGIKKSGIGRELSRYGLLEFTNIKTVWVN